MYLFYNVNSFRVLKNGRIRKIILILNIQLHIHLIICIRQNIDILLIYIAVLTRLQFKAPNGTRDKILIHIFFFVFKNALSTSSLFSSFFFSHYSRDVFCIVFGTVSSQGECIFLKHHKSSNRPSSHNARLQITRPATGETRTISAAIMRVWSNVPREKYSSIRYDHGN